SNRLRAAFDINVELKAAVFTLPLPLSVSSPSQGFLMQLVCNLLDEGNAAFREGEWMLARGHFSEGVSVAGYARAEGVQVPVALLESLYVNRAAALHNMGEWELGVRDCDAALGVSAGSGRALYRKAVCLKELGRMKDAYECSTLCLLSSPQVNTLRYTSVNNTSMSKCSVVPTHVPIVDVMGLGALPVPSPHLPPAFFPSAVNQLNSLDSFPEPRCDSAPPVRLLDALDSFSPVAISSQLPAAQGPPLVVGGEGLDSLSEFSLPGECPGNFSKIMLTHTLQGFPVMSVGPGVLDREFKPDLAHSCKKDILLCRRKGENPWRRVRPRPTRNNFLGAYVLCKEVLERQECKYGEACTFAYCQEEIDVWTQERRGLLTRELLFNPLSTNQRQALSVLKLLNIHNGMFMFLCEECFDSKPRIISKRFKESPSLCSNVVFHHQFDKNKCLVHVVKSSSICYSKVRPLSPLCQFDVCRHELRYGCQRENSCSFAHSFIELECWILQKDHGTTHEEIVQESKKHWHKQRVRSPSLILVSLILISLISLLLISTNGTVAKGEMVGKGAEMNGKAGPVQMSGGASAGDVATVKDLRLVMKFVCSQCWKDGQMSEPDRLQKYCNAKARHSWTKERRVLLVKSLDREKWVTVRPLPFAKTYPQQYDICVHVLKQKKCHYIGNCSFAHSPEERELWTYMKNTGLRELQQVYDVWLMTDNQNKRPNDTPLSPQSPPAAEEKQICMPTDFAELMVC
uniref:Zinc finger CCCH-type containing 7Ba n=1 Tax=Astyanax mexicanus TaxID=7994 RepID=A0A3B1IM54_ASTMX